MPHPESIYSRKREVRANGPEARPEHRFDTSHLRLEVCLEIRARGKGISDACPIIARESWSVRVSRSRSAEWREHTCIEAEFAKAFGKLRLIEKKIKPQHFRTSGVIQNREPDTVPSLCEGEVAQVVRSRRKLKTANELPVHLHLNSRISLQPERTVARGTDDGLRLKDPVGAEQ
jgi:hypothetical protein